MKKIFKGLCLLLAMIFVVACTACSGFFGEESIIISSVKTKTLEDGSTELTISYENEDKSDDVIIIPKGDQGIQGETGVGIKEITNELNANGNTDVTIHYTDGTKEGPFEIQKGVTIVGVEAINEGKTLKISYNNGLSSEFELPEGREGKPGMGIANYFVNNNPTNPALTASILFNMDDGTSITIDIPKGEAGRGIESMTGVTTETNYIIKVKYTGDDKIYDITFDRPTEPNLWYYDACEPWFSTKLDKSKVGDYFFDTAHNDIYLYQETSGWTCIVDYHDDEQTYTVIFDLNDNDGGASKASMPGALPEYVVNRGTYFTSNGYDIPMPTRTGYDFKGWCTSRVESPITGFFTTLTPIFSDLTLYAIWTPKTNN